MILPGRMIHAAGIAFIFHTQLAFGIAAGFGQLGGSNGFGILLRLGQVDGDINSAILGIHFPAHIPLNAVAADVVAVLAEFVEIFSSFLRRLGIQPGKFRLYLCRAGHQAVHEACIK